MQNEPRMSQPLFLNHQLRFGTFLVLLKSKSAHAKLTVMIRFDEHWVAGGQAGREMSGLKVSG